MPYSKTDTLFNHPARRQHRGKLRRELTAPEAHLWYKLRRRNLGARFRRQHGIGPYVVDFYCPAARLVVEVDGDSHYRDQEARRQDQQRDAWLNQLGLKVLRFTNREVMENREAVVEEIARWL